MDIQRGTITPQQWVEKYGKLSGAYFGLLPTLIVSDVEIVKEITIKAGFERSTVFHSVFHILPESELVKLLIQNYESNFQDSNVGKNQVYLIVLSGSSVDIGWL